MDNTETLTVKPTITVHCTRGRACELTREEFYLLRASGMLWEFYPDAPMGWPAPATSLDAS